MKIEVNVPDWAIGKDIYLFSGSELLGHLQFHYKKTRQDDGSILRENKYFPLKLKPAEGRCNGCGDCCSTGGSPFNKHTLYEIQSRLLNYDYAGSGTKCPLLADDGCVMRGSIPFSCAKSNCEGWSENCTEKLVPIDDNAIILDVV